MAIRILNNPIGAIEVDTVDEVMAVVHALQGGPRPANTQRSPADSFHWAAHIEGLALAPRESDR